MLKCLQRNVVCGYILNIIPKFCYGKQYPGSNDRTVLCFIFLCFSTFIFYFMKQNLCDFELN